MKSAGEPDNIWLKKAYKKFFGRIVVIILFFALISLFFNNSDKAKPELNNVLKVSEEIFLSSIEASLKESPNFVLISQNSIQAVSPLTIFTPRILGVLIDDGDETTEEDSEAKNEIVEYIVQSGDSLSSIADNFGISVNTIIWANNLRGTSIRPGQELMILPVSGIKHIVEERDNIGKIAEKYDVSAEKIIDFNNLSSDGDIFIGQSIIVPGGKKQARRLAVNALNRERVINTESVENINNAESVNDLDNISNNNDAVKNNIANIANMEIRNLTPNQVRAKFSTNNYWGESHSFPFGQCTWWVAQRRNVPWRGHARSWLNNAEKKGFQVCRGRDCLPKEEAVIVVRGNPVFGHVAYVEEVRDNKIIYSEMNAIGWGRINMRTIPIGHHTIIGFIY